MYKIIGYKRFIPNVDEDRCILKCSFTSWRDQRGRYSMPKYAQPLSTGVSSTIFQMVIWNSNVNIIASPLKIVKYILRQSMNMWKCLWKNAVHHFSEREFIPLAAAAAASLAVKDRDTDLTRCTDMYTVAILRLWLLFELHAWSSACDYKPCSTLLVTLPKWPFPSCPTKLLLLHSHMAHMQVTVMTGLNLSLKMFRFWNNKLPFHFSLILPSEITTVTGRFY